MKKKAYIKPALKKYGKIKDITLKRGSVGDFLTNSYTP